MCPTIGAASTSEPPVLPRAARARSSAGPLGVRHHHLGLANKQHAGSGTRWRAGSSHAGNLSPAGNTAGFSCPGAGLSASRVSLLTPRLFVDVMTTIRGSADPKSRHHVNKANRRGGRYHRDEVTVRRVRRKRRQRRHRPRRPGYPANRDPTRCRLTGQIFSTIGRSPRTSSAAFPSGRDLGPATSACRIPETYRLFSASPWYTPRKFPRLICPGIAVVAWLSRTPSGCRVYKAARPRRRPRYSGPPAAAARTCSKIRDVSV
jgi:hypothetical protein